MMQHITAVFICERIANASYFLALADPAADLAKAANFIREGGYL